MSIEKPNNGLARTPELGDITGNILLTSVNILDQLGRTYPTADGEVRATRWTEKATERSFSLQSRKKLSLAATLPTTYFLQVYPPFSPDADERYKYTSDGVHVKRCDEHWHPIVDEAGSDHEDKILEYLALAPLNSKKEDTDAYQAIVAETILNERRFRKRARAISVLALLGREEVATSRLIEQVLTKEPLLNEAEVRDAIEHHRKRK